MADNITKRKKHCKDKNKLWNLFDQEIGKKVPHKSLEILYSNSKIGNRDFCELCGSTLSFNEEKFLTCTNAKCGVIYKDILDQSAEWRYYGCDDNKGSDPTRCGMPVNPLLKESSYGCKVICRSNSTYEMRKVRRYTEWQSMPYKEKSQYDEFESIKLMAHNASMPKIIVDEAFALS